jgi:adenylosuccinate lyase
VRAVRAGGDRQIAHETIRKHSLAAARALKDGAERNNLLERLATDRTFGLKLKDLESVLDPQRFVGRAPQQVDEFLRDVITPLFAGETVSSERAEELRV